MAGKFIISRGKDGMKSVVRNAADAAVVEA